MSSAVSDAAAPPGAAPAGAGFTRLRVAAVEPLTANSVAVTLEVPDEQARALGLPAAPATGAPASS